MAIRIALLLLFNANFITRMRIYYLLIVLCKQEALYYMHLFVCVCVCTKEGTRMFFAVSKRSLNQVIVIARTGEDNRLPAL